MTRAPRQAPLASQSLSWLKHEPVCMVVVMLCKTIFVLDTMGTLRHGRQYQLGW